MTPLEKVEDIRVLAQQKLINCESHLEDETRKCDMLKDKLEQQISTVNTLQTTCEILRNVLKHVS